MSERSHRRDFLTGRSVREELVRAGERLAESQQSPKTPPAAGDTVRLETRAMACNWNVILDPGPAEQVMAASEALSIVHALEAQLTVFREESEVNALNRSLLFGDPFPVEQGLFELLRQCQQLHAETDGAFDPCVRPLLSLWRSCRQFGRLPTDLEVAHALSWVGMQHLRLHEAEYAVSARLHGLETPPLEIGIDLGAIGKGYAVDRAVQRLEQLDLPGFLLHGGYSTVFARGGHGRHAGWPVGIKNPLFTNRRLGTLVLCDQALSSSGSNVQFYRHAGKRYGHLLDPRTGWPAETMLSVSVIAPTAAQADALSTAFYVMGLDNSLRYCDDHPDIGALWIPFPHKGRQLSPIVRNISEDVLFFEESQV
ncbi:MAG: FAD:protein FMN transferase [Planctomycetaceae bacterium]|nr:FAD:protein FMN transferase [Planctomycetaceae bacterium]